MKQEIKERVEKIRKGEVPEGYKRTKVGIIPVDWEMCSINKLVEKDILEKPLDGNHGNIHPTNNDYVIEGIPFIKANNIHDGVIDFKNCNFLTKERAEQLQKGFSIHGDILLTHKGTVGNTAIVDKIPTEYIMLTPQVTYYRVKNHQKIINKYIKYYFDSKTFQSILENLSSGGTRAYIGITNQAKLPFVLPPLPEQQKIAEILSTWDKAIELKEKLIEEKKEFNRGLMQKLLTGKIRFPEFTDEWVEIDLKKIVEKINNKNHEKNQTIVTISAKKGFVNQNEYFNKIVASQDLSNYYLICKGDFAYNKSYSNGYPVGVIKRLESFEKAVVTTLYICFRIKDKTVSSDFLKYYFDSGLFNNQIKRIANEGGRAHGLLNVTPSDFFKIRMKIPDIFEQEKIADVLLSQDEKIHLMELTLDQLNEQKRGLMQLLLTGIVRVEVN